MGSIYARAEDTPTEGTGKPLDPARHLLAQAKPVFAAIAELDRARRHRIAELQSIGFRSRNFVGEYGERIASVYYGVPLTRPSTPGYDLELPDGRRVQVRTLRSTPENRRTGLGRMREPYDLLFAIRLDEDFVAEEALEVPREALLTLYGERPFVWSRALVDHPQSRFISADELNQALQL